MIEDINWDRAEELAPLVAELDEYGRFRRNHDRALWQAEKESGQIIDAEIVYIGDIVQTLTRTALLTSGHNTHKGQWRKKRDG